MLVEENKKLEEKFEHIEEKARQLERAKHDYEKKGSELEAAKAKAGADVMQRVAVEKKKLEAEFAVKLERSGAAALNAECEKLKKTIAQLTRTPCCDSLALCVGCMIIFFIFPLTVVTEELEAARGELTAQRQQLAQEKAAASESERGLRVQNDTLRAELAARDKKGMAEADVVYLKNTILQFMQAEQKEVRLLRRKYLTDGHGSNNSPCLSCVRCSRSRPTRQGSSPTCCGSVACGSLNNL